MLITHFSQQNYFFSTSFWCGHISIVLFTLCINFQKICFPLKWKRGHRLKPLKCDNVFQKHHTNGTRHQRNRPKVEGALDRAGPGRAKETKSKSPSYLLDPTLPDSRATPEKLQCHLKVSEIQHFHFYEAILCGESKPGRTLHASTCPASCDSVLSL